jgi:hypothetical protein
MARRIAEIILLGPTLDANYATVSSIVWAWVEPENADVDNE